MNAEELDALVLDDLQYKCAGQHSCCDMPSSRVASLYACRRYFADDALRLTEWRALCMGACLAPELTVEAENGHIRCVDELGGTAQGRALRPGTLHADYCACS